jgi:small ligand-binding sensory domain FIST
LRAAAFSSSSRDPAEAVIEVMSALRHTDLAPQTALVFATAHLARDPAALCEGLREGLGDIPFLGWIGASAYNSLQVRERAPGLVVLALEGVDPHLRTAPMESMGSHTATALLADTPTGQLRFAAATGENLDATSFLSSLDEQGVPVAGLVSATPARRRSFIITPNPLDGPSAGLLTLSRGRMLLGVAQGARALGPIRTITSAMGNQIREVDGRPAYEALLNDLPTALREELPRLGGSLYAGLSAADNSAFLMRNVVGLDPRIGAVAVAGQPRPGSEMLYAFRDGRAARGDLMATLDTMENALDGQKPKAILLFNCIARDEKLLDAPLFDVSNVVERLGGYDVPVVGASGAAEFCTTGASTHLFQYSAVIAVLLDDD